MTENIIEKETTDTVSEEKTGKVWRYEIEPCPYNHSHKVCVTDSELVARQTLYNTVEKAWAEIEEGQEKTIRLKMNKI